MLDAVRYHSVGLAEWDMVGRILYCADYLEPGRTHEREWRAELAARLPGRSARWSCAQVARGRVAHLVELGTAAPRTHGPILEQPRRRILRVALIARRGRGAGRGGRLAGAAAAARARAGHAYPIPSPGNRITVEVLNGTRRAGLARAATRVLRERGIDVVFFGNADPAADSTRVIVRRGDPGRGRDVQRGARRGDGRGRAGHAPAGGCEGDPGAGLSGQGADAVVSGSPEAAKGSVSDMVPSLRSG